MKLKLISEKLAKMANPLKKRPGFASLVLGTALALLPALNANAQMNNWTMPPFRFDATANPVGINNVLYPFGGSASGNYFVGNGVYDQSGALLFYVQDNQIYSSIGAPAGFLGQVILAGTLTECGGEIAIVPVPGKCSQYYVIYTRSSSSLPSGGLGWVLVDCPSPSSTPAITYGPGCCFPMAYIPSGFLNIYATFANSSNTGIAVSKRMGSGATAKYWLCFTTNYGIESCLIDASGISYYTAISPIPNAGSSTTELELSPDGKWLAVAQIPSGGGPGQVAIVNMPGGIGTVGSAISPSYYGTYNQISGLEFVGSGTPKLYITGKDVSGISAFDMIDLSVPSPPINNLISNIAPYTLDNSFIEYSKSGKVCGISDFSGHRYLLEYDPSSSSASTQYIDNPATVHDNPNGSNPIIGGYTVAKPYNGLYPASLYTLPDQIDGGDYDHFNTSVFITGMGINGMLAQNNCNGTAYDMYACAGVHLTAITNDDLKPCTQKLDITPYNLSECEDIATIGLGFLHYSDYVTDNIKDLAIHNLKDGYGNTLITVKGVYRVTLTITDCCGNSTSMTEIIKMRYAPSINLEIYDYLFPTYVPAGPLHSTPLGIGAGTPGFRVSNSTGDASNMNVQVDHLVGTWGGVISVAGNVINQDMTVTNLSSLTGEHLNNYCAQAGAFPVYPGPPSCVVTSPAAYSGNSNFFAASGPSIMGEYYRLTVTLSNECGTSSDYAFVQISDAYARPTGLQTLSAEKNAAQIYPNPANDKVQIAIKSRQSDVYQIALYDISGRLVKTIADKMSLDAGDHTLDVNTADLQTGVYTWKINSLGINQNGLLSVVK